jgi:thioredoxin reductase (NADPH)
MEIDISIDGKSGIPHRGAGPAKIPGMSAEHDFEVVVAGAGVAGLSAALFAARCGRSTAIVAPLPGGPLLSVTKIEDFPGFPEGVAGYELCPALQEQAEAAGAEFRMGEVERLEQLDAGWRLGTTAGDVTGATLILATGSEPKTLDVPGAERFAGHGISHCASCDAPLLRDKSAAVVGGGDSALLESLELADHLERVVILHRGPAFSAMGVLQQRVLESPKIEVRFDTVVEEVLGGDKLEGVRISSNGSDETLEVEGLFVYIGATPRTGFLQSLLTLDDEGRVPTDARLRTELPGLFAAGDIRSDSAAQAVAAAGDGASAAMFAHEYLAERVWPAAAAVASA